MKTACRFLKFHSHPLVTAKLLMQKFIEKLFLNHFFVCSIYSIVFFIFRDIRSTTGKLKRAVLQFTPVSWTHVRWLDPNSTYMRFFAVCQMVIFWQISELNTFFLKHIFEMPPSHPIVVGRLLFLGIMVAPSAR